MKHAWVLAAAVLAIGGGAVVLRSRAHASGDEVPLLTLAPGRFAEVVRARGELRSRSTVTVSAARSRTPMTITWLAPEGMEVETGDAVVEFESAQAREELTKADAEMRRVEEEILKHSVHVQAQKMDLEAEATRSRISRETAEFKAGLTAGVVPEVQIQEARMDLKLADMDVARVKRSIVSQAPKDAAALALLRIKLEKAKNQRDLAETKLSATKVKAEGRGMVAYKTIWKQGGMDKAAPGDTVWPGMPIVDLVDLSLLEFVAHVREEDAVHVAVGKRAAVELSAIRSGALEGKVTQVAAVAEQSDPGSALKSVEVKIGFDGKHVGLRSGLTGAADIEVRVEEPVLTVPLEAVVEEGEARFVYVDEGKPVKRPIKLGEGSDTAVVVASGLKAGERVYARDPTRTKEEIEAGRRARQKEARKKRKDSGGGGSRGIMIRF